MKISGKFAVSGCHGSGKTTLCHAVFADLKRQSISCGLVSEAARQSYLLMSGDKSEKMHVEILGLHTVAEMRQQFFHSLVLSDRSVFDFIAYARCRFLSTLQTSQLLRSMNAFIHEYSTTYDAIFVMRGSYGNPESDKIRGGEQIEFAQFDEELRTAMKDAGVEPIELDGIENKVDFVVNRILSRRTPT